MDVKAMAKSKRSHTQQHSKRSYPKPTSRGNVDAAKADGKSNPTTGEKVVEKPLQSQAAELPSNSDRYWDEDDFRTEDLLNGLASWSHGSEVIKPKSEGADYRHLISEAQSQTHSDLKQGFGDMLSARGEAILSWIAADYFILEDKQSPSYEASFLSLNLNTLNEQLAKVDLAQRLFIEPDILPPELLPHKCELPDDDKEGKFPFTIENMDSETDPGVASFRQPLHQVVTVLKEVAVASSNISDYDDLDDAAINVFKVKSLVKDSISPDSSRSLPTVKASQAEAELDMLLDSLGETDVHVSPQISSMQLQSHTEIQTSKTAPSLDDAINSLLSLRSNVKKTAASLYDATNDLLSSTSNMTKTAPDLGDAIDDLLSSTSNITKTAPGLDDAVDNLLDATSYMTMKDNTFIAQKLGTDTVELAKNSDSTSKTKMVDDFDSWLETLG